MGKTYTGDANVAANFKFSTAKPLDDRSVVALEDDLVNANTWKFGNVVTAYKGMIVTVADTGNTYVYIGQSGDTSNTTGVANQNNWKRVGGDVASKVVEGGTNAVSGGAIFSYVNGAISSAIRGIDTTIFVIDNDLDPDTAPGGNYSTNKIYIKPTQDSLDGLNLYTEYIVVATSEPNVNRWEKLGEFKATIDMSKYLDKIDKLELVENENQSLLRVYRNSNSYFTSLTKEEAPDAPTLANTTLDFVVDGNAKSGTINVGLPSGAVGYYKISDVSTTRNGEWTYSNDDDTIIPETNKISIEHTFTNNGHATTVYYLVKAKASKTNKDSGYSDCIVTVRPKCGAPKIAIGDPDYTTETAKVTYTDSVTQGVSYINYINGSETNETMPTSVDKTSSLNYYQRKAVLSGYLESEKGGSNAVTFEPQGHKVTFTLDSRPIGATETNWPDVYIESGKLTFTKSTTTGATTKYKIGNASEVTMSNQTETKTIQESYAKNTISIAATKTGWTKKEIKYTSDINLAKDPIYVGLSTYTSLGNNNANIQNIISDITNNTINPGINNKWYRGRRNAASVSESSVTIQSNSNQTTYLWVLVPSNISTVKIEQTGNNKMNLVNSSVSFVSEINGDKVPRNNYKAYRWETGTNGSVAANGLMSSVTINIS